VFADLDAITGRVLAEVQQGKRPDPTAVRFLLRQYRDGDRADLGDPLGLALAAALDRYPDDAAVIARANWLRLFGEAAAISDDARLAASARSLVNGLADEWPAMTAVDETAASVDACLGVLALVDAERIVPLAVDHIERVVGGTYRPGIGVMHAVGDASHARGTLADHVLAASALLSAFDITGRLPYSMLAEELMQLSRDEMAAVVSVDVACGAVGVWCRLAALHGDASYRSAAVIASSANYHDDASRMLERIASCVDSTIDSAMYGIAFGEWRAAHARDGTP
jgi:hypothetical protein